MHDDDLRAGVAQASREETAEHSTAGVQGTGAMEIVVSARWSVAVRSRCTHAPDGWCRSVAIPAGRMPQCAEVAAPNRWLQRTRGDPADEHRSITGIEGERDAEPVMAVRGFPLRGRSSER